MGGFLDPGNPTPLLAVSEGRRALCNVRTGTFFYSVSTFAAKFVHFYISHVDYGWWGEGVEGVCTC